MAVTGVFLAKLDGTAKGGVVMSIRDQLKLPVKFIGLGETPADIETFDPERFVTALFEQVEVNAGRRFQDARPRFDLPSMRRSV